MAVVRLADILQTDKMQSLLAAFHATTGIAVGIYDAHETWIAAYGWTRMCTEFHRACPKSADRCAESDDHIKKHLSGDRHVAYPCAHGLVDVAFPILIDGAHVGTFFIGQFFYEAPDEDWYRARAELYGYDVDGYIAALREVEIVPRPRVEQLVHFFKQLVELVTDLGHENLHRRTVEAQLRASHEELELRVAARTAELSGALAKVRTLHGLLPICAWCRRIRDDDGYWKQVEVYLQGHSDAQFTHSVCAECATTVLADGGATDEPGA